MYIWVCVCAYTHTYFKKKKKRKTHHPRKASGAYMSLLLTLPSPHPFFSFWKGDPVVDRMKRETVTCLVTSDWPLSFQKDRGITG